MPLVRISLRRGKPVAHHRAIRDGVYQALRETYTVPEGDRFMLVDEYEPECFDVSPDYLGIERSADTVIIQLTVSNTRGVAQKQALYQRIVALLARDPGLRPEDVMIVLTEVLPENWSFGRGEAQYVK